MNARQHGKPGMGRRRFLELCAGSAALAHWLSSAIVRAQGASPAQRLMILHRPNGSIAEDWIRGGQPGPILEPFSSSASVWPYALALKGVDVKPSGNPPQGHESGIVTLMTGAALGATQRTNDDYRSTAQSLDQTLLDRSSALSAAPIPSVQLAAHGSQDGGNEVPNTTLSYSGPAMPLYPSLRPDEVYRRVFGDALMPGGGSSANDQALAAARLRRRSVLDFVRGDLGRVRAQFPAEARAELDAHEEAIRELERGLEAPATPAVCASPEIEAALDGQTGDYLHMERVGAAQLKLVTGAFQCDLTRVVTFMWGTGASLVSFEELGTNNHHSTSHNNERAKLSQVDRWFSERTAPFIEALVATRDAAGKPLIDSTLVWYLSEVSEGWNHSHTDYPFVLFGGDGVGLTDRGRVLDVTGQGKTSNDVWSSVAERFGVTLTDGDFDTEHSGAFF
jgi:hypothetical protein